MAATHTKVDIEFEQRLARARASVSPSRLFTRLLLRVLSIFRNPFKLAGCFLLTGVTLLVIDYQQTRANNVNYYQHVTKSFEQPIRAPRAPAPVPRNEETVRGTHLTTVGSNLCAASGAWAQSSPPLCAAAPIWMAPVLKLRHPDASRSS